MRRNLLLNILQYEGQELGTHTFGHFYCLEQTNDNGAFDADLKAAGHAAKKFNINPVSLVFPRNQFNKKNLSTCINNGIQVVSTNPATWFWSPIRDTETGLMRKIFRTGDAYVPMSTIRTSYPLSSLKKKGTLAFAITCQQIAAFLGA